MQAKKLRLKLTYIRQVSLALFLITLLVLMTGEDLTARQSDHRADLTLRGNLGSETPFWLEHNRRGLISSSSAAQAGLFYEGTRGLRGRLKLGWGGEIAGGTGETVRERPLHQGWIGLSYQTLQLRGGMWEETVGITDPDLSAGPSIWGRNVRPMPKIKIELTDFTPVPLTGGWFQVMGGFSHGWFESGRTVEDFWLHEKYVYAKLGRQGYPEAYAGLIHMAQWGGYDTYRDRQIPEDLRHYFRMFRGREGIDMFQGNSFGNSLGSWQAGINYRRGRWEFLLNKETIFEDGSGLKLKSPEDGVQGLNIRYHHGRSAGPAAGSGSAGAGSSSTHRTLLPAQARTPAHLAVTGFTYEFWHTKSQSGPGRQNRPANWEGDPLYDEDGHRFGGRDNYFNHAVYRNGWSYYSRTIGVPFITHDPESGRMINNRLIAHHVGFLHQRGEWRVKLAYSWTKNYGAYDFPNNAEGPFDQPLTQNYTLAALRYDLSSRINLPLSVSLEAGHDWGEFKGTRTGLLVTWVYRLIGDG